MNELTADCAAFFKARPGYHRILELLLQKYRSFGRPAGAICLSDATPEECDAARALFGRTFSPPLRIKTADFEAALQDTPFHGVVLKEVLECYFDTVIQTKHQLSEQMDTRMLRIIGQAKNAVQSEVCHRWLDALSRKQGDGYHLIRTSLGKDENAVCQAILQACKSLEWLEQHPAERPRLAVLSAHATSDPHALDTTSLGGKLFLHLLSVRMDTRPPTAAEDRAALYYNCGILCDSISSSVTQIGVHLYTDTEEHPAYRAFRLRNEAGTLTLTHLAGITAAGSSSGKAYLVENQMVFSQLCDQAPQFHSPLICTSGQPTVAVFRLLDMLASSGTKLFYSGDFDGKGLSIALQLLARYPDHLYLWHMTGADYARCCSDVRLSEVSLALLHTCADTALAPTAEAIERKGYDGYQELLLSELLADLMDT